jgi:hypothetical protein
MPNCRRLKWENTNLRVTHASHVVVNTSAVDPNVSDNTTIRPTNRLVGDSFAFYKACQNSLCFLTTIFAKFRAINTRESYPPANAGKEGSRLSCSIAEMCWGDSPTSLAGSCWVSFRACLLILVLRPTVIFSHSISRIGQEIACYMRLSSQRCKD